MDPSGEFVTIPGGSATFICVLSDVRHYFIDSVQWQWLVNATLLEELELDNAHVVTTRQLRFIMISVEYNHTSIRCRATHESGRVSTSEAASLLLIQG